ncbi:MAG: hypothetical protein ACO22R_09725 [Chitinophagaceae bacterium]
MNDLFFQLMVAELKGERFNNFGLNQLAQTQMGAVKESVQHLKLSDRLYTPTVMERFAAK